MDFEWIQLAQYTMRGGGGVSRGHAKEMRFTKWHESLFLKKKSALGNDFSRQIIRAITQSKVTLVLKQRRIC